MSLLYGSLTYVSYHSSVTGTFSARHGRSLLVSSCQSQEGQLMAIKMIALPIAWPADSSSPSSMWILAISNCSAMFFWATRRALGETGSRHASNVIFSRLSTVRIALSPALEQISRYMLFHVFYVTFPLLLGIVIHRGGWFWKLIY